jgi:hypothetical protein
VSETNELQALREQYKAATGKNPAPNMNADKLREKIAAAPPALDPAAQSPAEAAAPAAVEEPAPAPVVEAPKPAPAAPLHTALLDHADPEASAVVNGMPVVRGKDGLFLVPITLVDELTPHGFYVVSEGR